jgi:hypothetical protein
MAADYSYTTAVELGGAAVGGDRSDRLLLHLLIVSMVVGRKLVEDPPRAQTE